MIATHVAGQYAGAPFAPNRAQHRIPSTNQHPIGTQSAGVGIKQRIAHGVCAVKWLSVELRNTRERVPKKYHVEVAGQHTRAQIQKTAVELIAKIGVRFEPVPAAWARATPVGIATRKELA